MMTADELRTYAKENNITLPNDKGANTNWNDEYCAQQSVITTTFLSMAVQKRLNTSASMSYQNKQRYRTWYRFSSVSAAAHSCKTKALNDRLTLAFNVNAAQSKGTTVDSAKDANPYSMP